MAHRRPIVQVVQEMIQIKNWMSDRRGGCSSHRGFLRTPNDLFTHKVDPRGVTAIEKIVLLGCLLFVLLVRPAFAGGNIVITGHDDDYHASGCRVSSMASAQFNAMVKLARSGAPDRSLPVLSFDHGAEVTNCLRALGIPYTNLDPDSGVPSAEEFDVRKYSAMVVASDASCGGCDNTPTSIANLKAASTAIGNFLNSGGGIVAFAAAKNAETYYSFLPASASGYGVPPSLGYSPTPYGISIGIPPVNGNETHNFFHEPGTGGVSKLYKVAEILIAGATPETLVCIDCTIGGLMTDVREPVKIIPPGELGSAMINRPLSASLKTEGGKGPFTWKAKDWPAGLGIALDPATGSITGTPTRSGTFQLPVELYDRDGNVIATQELTLIVAAAPSFSPYLIGPAHATVDRPVKLVVGLRSSKKDPQQPVRGVRAVMTGTIDGQTIEFHDDGQNGDESAGDGRYSAMVTFRNPGKTPVSLKAEIEGTDRDANGEVEVDGSYLYRGSGPIEVDLGSLRESSRSCKTFSPAAEQNGRLPMRLHLLKELPPGHSLEMKVAGKTLAVDEGEVSLAPGDEMEVCLVINARAASSDATAEPWLRVSIGASDPASFAIRLRWHVHGLPFWRRWLWLFELLAGLAALFFIIYGWIKPFRIPRGLAVTFVPEYDELDETTPQPLAQWRGVGIGWYRNARAFLHPNYRISGKAAGAVAVLVATSDGVWVRPGDGTTLFREIDISEWKEISPEGHSVRLGVIYRIGETSPFFRIAKRL